MPTDEKDKKDQSGLKKITEFAKFSGKTSDKDTIQCKSIKKQSVSALSPTSLEECSKKKQIMEADGKNESGNDMSEAGEPLSGQVSGLKELLNPLINEVRSLKDSMEINYRKLDDKYVQLESKLDNRYKNLEQVLLKHKDESSQELKDLKEAIIKQTGEISNEVSMHMESTRWEMEVLKEQNKILQF